MRVFAAGGGPSRRAISERFQRLTLANRLFAPDAISMTYRGHWLTENDVQAQPSEGRGQRFESSWVRQFSAIVSSAQQPIVQRSVSASSICSRCVHGVGL
jgi:hypothetical protein